MYAEERRIKIIEILSKDKKVDVNRLAHRFEVTGATIRSDLRNLEQTGILARTHGGAIEATKTGFESDMGKRSVEHLRRNKKLLARPCRRLKRGTRLHLIQEQPH